jgi:hypothetical protein
MARKDWKAIDKWFVLLNSILQDAAVYGYATVAVALTNLVKKGCECDHRGIPKATEGADTLFGNPIWV